MSELDYFINHNRKICWEAEFEDGQFCIGEEKVKQFFEELGIENKDLLSENRALREIEQTAIAENKALKESRDELLETLKQYPEGELEKVYVGAKFVYVSRVIQRAEALKEKEE